LTPGITRSPKPLALGVEPDALTLDDVFSLGAIGLACALLTGVKLTIPTVTRL
jgi:hypothetical protein